MQRREHARYRLWFPVQLEVGGKLNIAMNQNIGAGGMLIALCANFKVGDSVAVTFRLPPGDHEHSVSARIVRLEANADDPDGEWPLKAGIAFEEVAPDLVPYLEDAVARFGA